MPAFYRRRNSWVAKCSSRPMRNSFPFPSGAFANGGRALRAPGAGTAIPYPPPKVMRRMTSWPSSQRCLNAAATWPAATASIA